MMFHPTESVTNISHHLLHRESNYGLLGEPRLFSSQLYRERLRVARNLFKTDLKGHFGCVNAIEFSHGGQFLASGGDDKRILVWDIEKSLAGVSNPRSLATEQSSNIFCLGFDSRNRKLISGGNDGLAISHDFETGKLDNVFKHEEPVYGLSIDPQNDSIFATASENGVVLLFDQRADTADPLVVASLSSSFHAVEFHPHMSHLLVTANSKRGAALYDIRKPKEPVIQYVNMGNPRSCMSVRFNKTGNLILGLRRRLTPVLYSVNSPERICTFYHSYYYNSCTMKSCTFAGEDDELVISGSDDFNLYVWRLSDIDFDAVEQWVETTQMVLYGHRSIVNQVRYNREKCLLASSGVEKIVKIWSPFSQSNWSGSLTEEAKCSDNPRELYSPYNLFTMALPENWHHLSHDYSSENTNEDPRMMAFFDSLIQQEIEGWDTDESSSGSSQDEEQSNASKSGRSSNSSSSSSSNSNIYSSSSSLSSSSSDSDNDNNKKSHAAINSKISFHTKRKLTSRTSQKPARKQPRKEAKSPQTSPSSLNQSQAPPNRIAYLISKKSSTLRRLALKGSLLDSRRSNKKVAATKGHSSRKSKPKRSKRRLSTREQSDAPNCNSQSPSQSDNSNVNNIDRPTTSKAAASNLSSCHNKIKIDQTAKISNDSNYSSDENTDNFAISNSSRSNVANVSSSSNNANIPSTSTGITSNFRDAFLRLSRQIFMSDSDDDSDSARNEQEQNDKTETFTSNDTLPNTTSKLNGATTRTATNTSGETHVRSVVQGPNSNTNRSIRSCRHKPNTTAALNVNKNNKNMLPQESNATTTIKLISHDDVNTDCGSGNSSSSSSSGSSSIHSSTNGSKSSNFVSCNGRNSYKTVTSTKRRCPEYDLPSYNENTFSSTSSSSASTTSAASVQREQTHSDDMPIAFSLPNQKNRKISINDYIQVRSSATDLQDEEENNNETNNNDIFAIENNSAILSGRETPQRIPLDNIHFSSYLNGNGNNNNISACLFTPDSGVSLNNSLTTPSTEGNNDSHGASTSHSSRILSRLSPCFEDDCNVDNANDDTVHINNRNAALNNYRQKLARVRRNYRKHFVDENESD